MKLLICIIDDFYADEAEQKLKEKGYRMTKLSSSGGFFKKGNSTFLFGVEEDDLDLLFAELQATCLEIEQKKEHRSEQTFRYTSFLIKVDAIAP